MQLPAPLFRNKKNVHKNNFGHVLILAGSRQMLGAAALTGLSALRAGTGLVTIGTPESLNVALQKKVNNSIMTLPLKETKEGSIHLKAWDQIKTKINSFDVVAIGPGLSTHPSTVKFVIKIIESAPNPLVIDADGLNAISSNLNALNTTQTEKVLTPHIGEFARLTGIKKQTLIDDAKKHILTFIQKHPSSTLLLKGHHTIVAAKNSRLYTNKTGNAGMAKAGSGDVLTGIIASFIAQGVEPPKAAKFGCYVHGLAGDIAAKTKSRTTMIAEDTILALDQVFKKQSHPKT